MIILFFNSNFLVIYVDIPGTNTPQIQSRKYWEAILLILGKVHIYYILISKSHVKEINKTTKNHTILNMDYLLILLSLNKNIINIITINGLKNHNLFPKENGDFSCDFFWSCINNGVIEKEMQFFLWRFPVTFSCDFFLVNNGVIEINLLFSYDSFRLLFLIDHH